MFGGENGCLEALLEGFMGFSIQFYVDEGLFKGLGQIIRIWVNMRGDIKPFGGDIKPFPLVITHFGEVVRHFLITFSS